MRIGEKRGLRAAEERLIKKALSWAELNRNVKRGYIHREHRDAAEELQRAADEYEAELKREKSCEVPSQLERIAARIRNLGYDPAKTPWKVAKQVCEAEIPGWTVMEPNEPDATYDFSTSGTREQEKDGQ